MQAREEGSPFRVLSRPFVNLRAKFSFWCSRIYISSHYLLFPLPSLSVCMAFRLCPQGACLVSVGKKDCLPVSPAIPAQYSYYLCLHSARLLGICYCWPLSVGRCLWPYIYVRGNCPGTCEGWPRQLVGPCQPAGAEANK